MIDNLQETTKGGERWDQIAAKNYGALTVVVEGVEKSAIGLLIEANPDVPIYDTFPAGVVLNIPIIEKTEVKIEAELLPPWKR